MNHDVQNLLNAAVDLLSVNGMKNASNVNGAADNDSNSVKDSGDIIFKGERRCKSPATPFNTSTPSTPLNTSQNKDSIETDTLGNNTSPKPNKKNLSKNSMNTLINGNSDDILPSADKTNITINVEPPTTTQSKSKKKKSSKNSKNKNSSIATKSDEKNPAEPSGCDSLPLTPLKSTIAASQRGTPSAATVRLQEQPQSSPGLSFSDVSLDSDGDFPMSDIRDKPPTSKAKAISFGDDVRHLFDSNCKKALNVGEIIHRGSFGLIDAMSAIELMDPKMDAGMQVNQLIDPFPLTFESLKMEGFSHAEYIGIFDETLACLATWLDGQPVMPTLFSNVYLSDPSGILDPTLRITMSGFVALAVICHRIIRAGNVYAEEDFQCALYPKTQEMMNKHDCNESLRQIIILSEDLRKQIKIDEKKSPRDNENLALQRSLLARVKILRCFIEALQYVLPTVYDADKEKEENTRMLVLYEDTLRYLVRAEKTINLGLQNEHCSRHDKHNKKLMDGFDASFAKSDLPPTYPRPVHIVSRPAGYQFLVCTLNKLITCKGVFNLNIHDSLEFMISYGREDSCILSRSVLQCLHVYRIENWAYDKFLLDVENSLKKFISPPCLTMLPIVGHDMMMTLTEDHQLKFDQMIKKAAEYSLLCFKTAGHHISRQRSDWGELMNHLAIFQQEANELDSLLQELLTNCPPSRPPLSNKMACFGSWAFNESILNMIRYVTDGLFLRLYSSHEYRYIFWYLHSCLYSWLKSTYIRADEFLLHQKELIEVFCRPRQKSLKMKKSYLHSKELAMCQTYHHLYDAYYKTISGLTMGEKIKYPKFDFDCEGVRFKHRFMAFMKLTAFPVVTYEQYKNCIESESQFTEIEMYNFALLTFEQVRIAVGSIQQTQEITKISNICKRNAIVLRILISGYQPKEFPTYDFSQHPSFPIIKIV